uniref:Cysteine-rich PDZ-binding protein n=1 Tax=Canis lupus familiaris TaxID=9615 RepID=A0A8P0P456_CANLF
MNERTRRRGWAKGLPPRESSRGGGPWRAHPGGQRPRPRPRPRGRTRPAPTAPEAAELTRATRGTCPCSPPPTSAARDSARASPRASVNGGGAALRGISKRARARRPRRTEGATHRDGSEGRVHRGCPRVTPEGWPSGGRRAPAGRGHRRSRPRGQWVGAAGTPGGSRAGRAPLGLPNSPASGRGARATTSHHQVRLAALANAQAQACGAETQGGTANCRSGGAGNGRSPASHGLSGVGRAGRPEADFRNPEGDVCPGCCVDILELLLFLRPGEPSGKDGVRKIFDPYGKNKFSTCRICKSSVHQPGSHYCQGCAYKKGICAMCGKKVLDTKNYKQTSV